MSTDLATSALTHEVPAALQLRPCTTLILPFGRLRLPTRMLILSGIALVLWMGVAMISGAWQASFLGVATPTALFLFLVEGTIQGRTPLAWGYVALGYWRQRAVCTQPRLLRPPRRTS